MTSYGSLQLRRYIRNHTTRMFLTENGEWTSQLARAKSWPDLVTMHDWCLRYGLREVDMVLMFDNDAQHDCVFHLT